MKNTDEQYVGQRFERLTAIGFHERRGRRKIWECKCDCGRTTLVCLYKLKSGYTKSCGCLRVDVATERLTTHGKGGNRVKSRAYSSWLAMRARCTYPRNLHYHLYGGRGIKVCPEWLTSFEVFFADMGEPPEGMSLDRIDVNGDYTKENCRWATDKEQANNCRDNSVIVTPQGKYTLQQFAAMTGMNRVNIRKQLLSGVRLIRGVAVESYTPRAARHIRNK